MPKKNLQEARQFMEELAENPPWLPYEPTLLPVLFAATRDDSTSSVDDITVLIERSQKLTTRVLSIANSAVYALEATITSLNRAISLLGFREVRTLVIMVGAVSAIKGAKLPKGFDGVGLWKHQLRTATIARELTTVLLSEAGAGKIPKEEVLSMQPDEAYVAGLLHDIGKVFLAAIRPNIWTAIEEISNESGLSFVEAEDAYWGMDHALIGAQVLHHWKLPLLLTDTINWHHAPTVAPAFKPESKMLAAANLIAHHPDADSGEIPDEAMLLLPNGVNPGRISTALKTALTDKKTESFSSLME